MDDYVDKALFQETSVRFIRAAKAALGDDRAAELVRVIDSFIGEGWASKLTLSILSDDFAIGRKLQISKNSNAWDGSNWPYKIQAIKAIRTVTGGGLALSKHAAELAMTGQPQELTINKEAVAERWIDGGLTDAMNQLRQAGLFAEIL